MLTEISTIVYYHHNHFFFFKKKKKNVIISLSPLNCLNKYVITIRLSLLDVHYFLIGTNEAYICRFHRDYQSRHLIGECMVIELMSMVIQSLGIFVLFKFFILIDQRSFSSFNILN